MRKFVIGFAIVVLIVFILSNNYREVCFPEKCFKVKVADSESERVKGLSCVTKVDGDGMLFVFDRQDIYGFWMKDTLIALDMIWIDEDERVVFIKENALPCEVKCEVVYPDGEALYVLEIEAGQVRENNINVGTLVKI